MYKIKNWDPNRPNKMAASGFSIVLTKEWKDAVGRVNIKQSAVDAMISSIGKDFLIQHGFSANRIGDVKISWGEWGIEHITVPGNACGLDIDYAPMGYLNGEVALMPHNVDTIFQASLILSLFLWFANALEHV